MPREDISTGLPDGVSFIHVDRYYRLFNGSLPMDKIVKSIVRVLLLQALSPFAINEKLAEETGFLLNRKIKRMPSLIRLSIYTSTFIFDCLGVFHGGCRFSGQNIEKQQKMIGAAEHYGGGPLKQFLKFYQKLSLYIYYSLSAELR
jgi:hypothetical protein